MKKVLPGEAGGWLVPSDRIKPTKSGKDTRLKEDMLGHEPCGLAVFLAAT